MRTVGLVAVVVVALAGSACFRTARYERAHVQRVERITAHYDAERRLEDERAAALLAALERYRARLIPIQPGTASTPVMRVGERFDILECRTQCDRRGLDESLDGVHRDEPSRAQCLRDICEPAYADALARTYSEADLHRVTREHGRPPHPDLESLLALSHNQAILAHIDEETRRISELHAQTLERLERERRAELATSARQRDAEIASGRAEHRARVLGAAHAFDASRRGPLATRPPCPCSPADPHAGSAIACRPAPAQRSAHSAQAAGASVVR